MSLKIGWNWLIALTFLFGSTITAVAQNPFEVVRRVNSSVITFYDIDQRLRLYNAFGFQPKDPWVQALRELTEDRLKQEAGVQFGADVPQSAIDEGIERYASQRQVTIEDLDNVLAQNGVAPETFSEFIATSLIWRGILDAQFRRRATPSEEDVATNIALGANIPEESYFLREIAIPFSEWGETEARELADKIRGEVLAGASFQARAREFSRASTAQSGGDIGWTLERDLPPQISTAILALEAGGISQPILLPVGVILIQVANVREETTTTTANVSASYVRIDFPLGIDASAEAAEMVQSIDTCADAEVMALEHEPTGGRFSAVPISEMDDEMAQVVDNLDAGEVGIMEETSEHGLSIVVLCNRQVDVDPEDANQLRTRLFNQNMQSFGAGYLQELRANAVISDG